MVSVNIDVTISTPTSKLMTREVAPRMMRTFKSVQSSIKSKGRASIRQAGGNFKNLANAWRVNLYPQRSQSWHPAVYGHMNTASRDNPEGYAALFETGGTIRPTRGRFLWIPTPAARKLMGKNRLEPREWQLKIGELFPIKTRGGGIMLMGRYGVMRSGKAQPSWRGKRSKQQGQLIPIYFGVRSVTIRRKFNLRAIMAAEAARIPMIFRGTS